MTVGALLANCRPPGSKDPTMIPGSSTTYSAPQSSIMSPDHSLPPNDLINVMVASPTTCMYETDPLEGISGRKHPLLSPSGSDPMCSPHGSKDTLTFDLCPKFEESEDLHKIDLDKLCDNVDAETLDSFLKERFCRKDDFLFNDSVQLSDIDDSPLQNALKDEDSEGPTLAQLNNDNAHLDRMDCGVRVSQLTCPVTRTDNNPEGVRADVGKRDASLILPHTNMDSENACGSDMSNTMVTQGSAFVTTSNVQIAAPVLTVQQVLGSQCLMQLPQVQPPGVLFVQTVPSHAHTNARPVVSAASNMDRRGSQLQQLLGGPPDDIKPHTSQTPESKKTLLELQAAPKPVEPQCVPHMSPPPYAVAVASKAKSSRMENKRSSSPGEDSNSSTNSMERKWREIKDMLDSNIKQEDMDDSLVDHLEHSLSPARSVKMEPQDDIAYHPPEADTYIKSEPMDSDLDHSDSECKQDMDMDDDDEDDDFSGAESDTSNTSFVENVIFGGRKDKRYFWQYNTQSKGPKGKRLAKTMEAVDPHILNDFEDPVFDPDMNEMKYKHSGKARRGDGNDITPNPWKLFQIGNELHKLNRKITGLVHNNEVPMGVKSRTRREKNKFASRACRLKKKAQHEANKIKLHGLEQEHQQLNCVLQSIKKDILERMEGGASTTSSLTSRLDNYMKSNLSVMIAGNTADYVNNVLENVANGDKSGGIYSKNE